MKYDLKTTVFPDGCVVNVHSPQLSEDERAKAVANLKEAAQRYARSVIKQKTIKEKVKQ
jgi:hypothetical protein